MVSLVIANASSYSKLVKLLQGIRMTSQFHNLSLLIFFFLTCVSLTNYLISKLQLPYTGVVSAIVQCTQYVTQYKSVFFVWGNSYFLAWLFFFYCLPGLECNLHGPNLQYFDSGMEESILFKVKFKFKLKVSLF